MFAVQSTPIKLNLKSRLSKFYNCHDQKKVFFFFFRINTLLFNLKQGRYKRIGPNFISILSQQNRRRQIWNGNWPSSIYKNCLLGQKMDIDIALPTNKGKFTLVKNFTKYKMSSHKVLIFQYEYQHLRCKVAYILHN